MSEPWTHFQGAMRVLVGAGPIKQRLIEAYRGTSLRSVTRTCPNTCRLNSRH
jgi:hypothetical protein